MTAIHSMNGFICLVHLIARLLFDIWHTIGSHRVSMWPMFTTRKSPEDWLAGRGSLMDVGMSHLVVVQFYSLFLLLLLLLNFVGVIFVDFEALPPMVQEKRGEKRRVTFFG